ncbi:MAG: hypothetical protein AAF533_01980 [Acidobacteriota bacterium]
MSTWLGLGTDWEWRTPARQRWVSMAASILISTLIGVFGGPLLLLLPLVVLDALGQGPGPMRGNSALVFWCSGIVFGFLLSFAVLTRQFLHSVSLTEDEIQLRGPLRRLRIPLATVTDIEFGLRDGGDENEVSLGVEAVEIRSKTRRPARIWLEPSDADVFVGLLTRHDPDELRAALAEPVTRPPPSAFTRLSRWVEYFQASLFLGVLAFLLGGGVRAASKGEGLAWLSIVLLGPCLALLVGIRLRGAANDPLRVLALIDLVLIAGATVLGYSVLS